MGKQREREKARERERERERESGKKGWNSIFLKIGYPKALVRRFSWKCNFPKGDQGGMEMKLKANFNVRTIETQSFPVVSSSSFSFLVCQTFICLVTFTLMTLMVGGAGWCKRDRDIMWRKERDRYIKGRKVRERERERERDQCFFCCTVKAN